MYLQGQWMGGRTAGMVSVNIAALVLRLVVGGTMMAHGWNHAFGGGKLPGTARWFESIGIRPGRVGLAIAALAGAGGAALLLATCWRPHPRTSASAPVAESAKKVV
jgi:uncharacterized membrane protein YphA (DoxX/SURF4 family)